MSKQKVQVVEQGLALESLRDSDFDTASAVGEIIDNSIQAGATKIEIWSEEAVPKGKRHPYIKELTFIDNGSGMPADILHHCMRLGWSSRSNARGESIGRFGVGATLAGIHECNRIEVYSRQKAKSNWLKVCLDLDEIKSATKAGQMPGLDYPEPADLPLPGGAHEPDSGTVVKWLKLDRMVDNADKTRKYLTDWIGRTFRYFIWENDLQIFLDGKLVPAHDPLYVRTEKTAFPNDPKGELWSPIELTWTIDDEDRKHTQNRTSSKIVVRFSMLPKEWRKKDGDGGTQFARDRRVDENEGISIMRNKREVFYGHIPYWDPSFKEIDRWWGCEILFNADLDRAFQVRNIKRGAVPIGALKDELKSTLKGVIKSARDKYTATKEEIKEKNALGVQPGSALGGDDTEGVIGDSKPPPTKRKTESDSNSLKKFVENLPKNEQDSLWKRLQKLPLTIDDRAWDGQSFFNVMHLGGKIMIEINQAHKFFEELKVLENQPSGISFANLKQLVGLIIASYAIAESQVDESVEIDDVRDFFADLRGAWGRQMREALKKVSHGES